MQLENPSHQRSTLRHWQVWKTDYAGVSRSMQEHELAEIRIDGHQHSVFGCCTLEQCRIAGVRAELIGEEGVMAFAAQPTRQPFPGARINEESHPLTTDTADSESPATTAWA